MNIKISETCYVFTPVRKLARIQGMCQTANVTYFSSYICKVGAHPVLVYTRIIYSCEKVNI